MVLGQPPAIQPNKNDKALAVKDDEEGYYDPSAYSQDEWDYPGNTYGGKLQSSDHATQTRIALFDVNKLNTEDGFGLWQTAFWELADIAPRIPNIDMGTYQHLVREFKDIVARAHSEGRAAHLASMCQELYFKMRLLVSTGETPMSGMQIMISQHTMQNAKVTQELKTPPPPSKASFWNPWGNK